MLCTAPSKSDFQFLGMNYVAKVYLMPFSFKVCAFWFLVKISTL